MLINHSTNLNAFDELKNNNNNNKRQVGVLRKGMECPDRNARVYLYIGLYAKLGSFAQCDCKYMCTYMSRNLGYVYTYIKNTLLD